MEKIKTIGDSYMAVAGVPESHTDPVRAVCDAALEIRKSSNRISGLIGPEGWNIRIGLHIGPLIAGVIGRQKFSYDVWGATVNLASRMESGGEPGRINASAEIYARAEPFYRWEPRGPQPIKRLGLAEMYFLRGKEVAATVRARWKSTCGESPPRRRRRTESLALSRGCIAARVIRVGFFRRGMILVGRLVRRIGVVGVGIISRNVGFARSQVGRLVVVIEIGGAALGVGGLAVDVVENMRGDGTTLASAEQTIVETEAVIIGILALHHDGEGILRIIGGQVAAEPRDLAGMFLGTNLRGAGLGGDFHVVAMGDRRRALVDHVDHAFLEIGHEGRIERDRAVDLDRNFPDDLAVAVFGLLHQARPVNRAAVGERRHEGSHLDRRDKHVALADGGVHHIAAAEIALVDAPDEFLIGDVAGKFARQGNPGLVAEVKAARGVEQDVAPDLQSGASRNRC